jgi:hypothetical protein
MLATIGKRLTGFGSGLEERYGMQPESASMLNQQSSPGGC